MSLFFTSRILDTSKCMLAENKMAESNKIIILRMFSSCAQHPVVSFIERFSHSEKTSGEGQKYS